MSDILRRRSWAIQPGSAAVTSDRFSLFVVGFAARDRSGLAHHIDELRSQGVRVPRRTPVIWSLDARLVDGRSFIGTSASRSSGEVVPVLLRLGGRWMLTVGSDHTDRVLERQTLIGSKRACPKPVSSECWDLRSVETRWDALLLRSWIRRGNDWVPYQEGGCSELRPPGWYIHEIDRRRPAGDCVVFCGTVSTIRGLELGAVGFRGELEDPVSGLQLRCEYSVADQAVGEPGKEERDRSVS